MLMRCSIALWLLPCSFGQSINKLAELPLSFEENRGQFSQEVRFAARAGSDRVLLTANGTIIEPSISARSALEIRWLGSSSGSPIRGVAQLPGHANYFLGNDPAAWHTNVPLFEKVRQDEIYPGIRLEFYGRERRLEYDLVVSPGADPGKIRLGVNSARGVKLDANGDLILPGAGGEVHWRKPNIFQVIEGARRAVSGEYRIAAAREVRFRIGEYDRSKELVIDPVLEFATFVGGQGQDVPKAIAVGADGSTYVAGTTQSSDFPILPGGKAPAPQTAPAFILKLNATGSALEYVTFVSEQTGIRHITVDKTLSGLRHTTVNGTFSGMTE